MSENLIPIIGEILNNYDRELYEEAWKNFNGKIFDCERLNELKNFAGRGIVKIGLCNNEKCVEEVEKCGSVLGVNENNKNERKKCIVCGKKATEVVFGKTY